MRISDWSSDVCSSDLSRRRWRVPSCVLGTATIQPVAAQVDPINGKFPADTRGAATREPGQAPLSMRRSVPLHGSDPATYVAPSSSRSPTYPIDNSHILSIRCGDFQRWGAPPCIPPPRAGRRAIRELNCLSSDSGPEPSVPLPPAEFTASPQARPSAYTPQSWPFPSVSSPPQSPSGDAFLTVCGAWVFGSPPPS